jgi:hypothetical protein
MLRSFAPTTLPASIPTEHEYNRRVSCECNIEMSLPLPRSTTTLQTRLPSKRPRRIVRSPSLSRQRCSHGRVAKDAQSSSSSVAARARHCHPGCRYRLGYSRHPWSRLTKRVCWVRMGSSVSTRHVELAVLEGIAPLIEPMHLLGIVGVPEVGRRKFPEQIANAVHVIPPRVSCASGHRVRVRQGHRYLCEGQTGSGASSPVAPCDGSRGGSIPGRGC